MTLLLLLLPLRLLIPLLCRPLVVVVEVLLLLMIKSLAHIQHLYKYSRENSELLHSLRLFSRVATGRDALIPTYPYIIKGHDDDGGDAGHHSSFINIP